MNNTGSQKDFPKWRTKLHEIIFEADTPEGKTFDIALLIFIVLSVIAVLLDSVISINKHYGYFLMLAEWLFTIIFTVEYIVRIISTKQASKYIFSFYGIIDLLAILPTYLSLILAGSQFLIVIRIIRLLRIFRVLKLARFVRASNLLVIAVKQSRHKIIVFLEVVFTLVIIMGSFMYLTNISHFKSTHFNWNSWPLNVNFLRMFIASSFLFS